MTSQALLTDLGCRQALPRLIEQLVPNGQPETAHIPAHLGLRAGLAFPFATGKGREKGPRDGMERQTHLILSVPGPALGFCGVLDEAAGQLPTSP